MTNRIFCCRKKTINHAKRTTSWIGGSMLPREMFRPSEVTSGAQESL